MILTAEGVSVDGPHGPLLRPTSLQVGSGEIALVSGTPGAGHTALALALGGRLRPSRGRVLLDGADDAALLRSRVAVVDTPGVSEPDPVLPLRAVVGEELAMAGRGTLPRSVVAWLGARGAAEFARTRFEDVPAATRLALMLELAAMRPGVEVLVLTVPDRHGGTPQQWWSPAAEHAAAGRVVVVTCADSSAELVGAPTARLGGDTVAASEPPGATTPGRHEGAPAATAAHAIHTDDEDGQMR